MLKFTRIFQREKELEKEREKEINEIVQKISDIEKEFSLPLAIKKLYEKRKKTPEEKKTLDTLLAMYKEKQNEFKPSVSASTELNQAKNQEIQVPTPSDVKVMDQLKEIQVTTPSGVEAIDQLQKVQVKPLPTPSGLGMTDELAKKIAKRRALLDQQVNINTGNVSDSKEIIVETELVNIKKSSQEHVLTLKKQLLNVKLKPINLNDIQKQLPQNEENLSVNENTSNEALPVISEETDSSLNSLSELEKEKNQIALEEKLQELSDAQKQLEVLLQSLKDPADCNVSSLNAGYFKKSSSTDDVILRAILKP